MQPGIGKSPIAITGSPTWQRGDPTRPNWRLITAAAMHSAITVWYRWPMLVLFCALPGNPRHARELVRMLGEKAAAAVQGGFYAQQELLRVAGAAMSGKLDAMMMPESATAIIAESAARLSNCESKFTPLNPPRLRDGQTPASVSLRENTAAVAATSGIQIPTSATSTVLALSGAFAG